MKSLINSIKLYFKYISFCIRSQMQYKASFIIISISQFLSTIIDFMGIWILFKRFGNINGWGVYEVGLFYGTINISFSLAECIGRGLDLFDSQIISGDFDRLLVRPRTAFLQIIGQEFPLTKIGRLFQGLFIMIYCAIKLNINWSASKIILLLSANIGGLLLFISLFLLQATLSFWSVQSLELINMLTYGGVETAQYPLSVYTKAFRNFFIFIIPLGCVNYLPVAGILEKDPLGFPKWSYYIASIAGFLFMMVCMIFWKIGIKHYKSTGS